MIETDFIILTLPRSGSHMLASALNSHPDICCLGELFRKPPLYDWLGTGNGITGGIVWPDNFNQVKTKKVIGLIRNPRDMAYSAVRKIGNDECYVDHALLPCSALSRDPGQKRIDSMLRRSQALAKLLDKLPDALILTYEMITNNMDIRIVPVEISTRICSFLGVPPYLLQPRTYKPTVTGI